MCGGEQEGNRMNMTLIYYCTHICENLKKSDVNLTKCQYDWLV